MKICKYKWEPLVFIRGSSAVYSYDSLRVEDKGYFSFALPIFKEFNSIKALPYLDFLTPSADEGRGGRPPLRFSPSSRNEHQNHQDVKRSSTGARSVAGFWKRKLSAGDLEVFMYVYLFFNIYPRREGGKNSNFRIDDAIRFSRNNRIVNIDDMSDFEIFINSGISNIANKFSK